MAKERKIFAGDLQDPVMEIELWARALRDAPFMACHPDDEIKARRAGDLLGIPVYVSTMVPEERIIMVNPSASSK